MSYLSRLATRCTAGAATLAMPKGVLRRAADPAAEEEVQMLRGMEEEEAAQPLRRQEEEEEEAAQAARRQEEEEEAMQAIRRQEMEEADQPVRRQEEEEEPMQALRRQEEEEGELQTLRREGIAGPGNEPMPEETRDELAPPDALAMRRDPGLAPQMGVAPLDGMPPADPVFPGTQPGTDAFTRPKVQIDQIDVLVHEPARAPAEPSAAARNRSIRARYLRRI